MNDFEAKVRQRTLHSFNYETARVGHFVTVADLQQFAIGAQYLATPDAVKGLALYFHIPIPPGYGAAERAA